MCQILAFTNTKKLNLKKCLNDIGNTLLAADDDGFGFAIQGKNGVFGEKTISKKFRTRLGRINHITLPIVKANYMQFGNPGELVGPGVFHGRSSTNEISLENTHPMQMENWNLIHNGVVDDSGPNYLKYTTNDSEDVLRRLLDGVGRDNPMEAIERYLEGYYAFTAIDPQGRLHVGRDSIAPLCIAKSAKYDTYIIGTTDSLILKVSKILDAKIGPIEEINDEVYLIFEGNNLVHSQSFKSKGYSVRQTRHAATSLHNSHRDFDFGGWNGGDTVHRGNVVDTTTRVVGLQPPIRVPLDEYEDDDKTQDIEIAENGIDETRFNSAADADSLVDFLTASHNEKLDKVTPDEYNSFRDELDGMDASYTIHDVDGKKLNLIEFRKLDPVHQEMCSIVRGDGTVVDLENYHVERLLGGRYRHDA